MVVAAIFILRQTTNCRVKTRSSTNFSLIKKRERPEVCNSPLDFKTLPSIQKINIKALCINDYYYLTTELYRELEANNKYSFKSPFSTVKIYHRVV